MDVEVFGPCLLVEDVPASARFYIEHFGFQPRVELDWFDTEPPGPPLRARLRARRP